MARHLSFQGRFPLDVDMGKTRDEVAIDTSLFREIPA
jgi:hypothetical protein